MKKPEPEIGQIVRFDYLWRDEKLRGRVEGTKDRPCAVILAVTSEGGRSPRVLLAPITHAPPRTEQVAIEIPSGVQAMTGLDDDRSWLVLSEVNRVDWTEAGIVPARPDRWLFGHLPRGLAVRAAQTVLALIRQRTLRSTDRNG